MKKTKLFTVLISIAVLISACTSTPASTTPQNSEDADEKINIVATSYHEYDWVSQIIGKDNNSIELTLLMDNGVDLHSYEPSIADISVISSADLFIYNGGESQDWVQDIIADPLNENLQTISVMQALGSAVKAEEYVEGMQYTEHDHGDDHAHDEAETHDHDHAHEDEHAHADEHVHEDTHDHAHDEAETHDHAHEDEHAHEDTHDHAHDEAETHDHAHEEGHDDEHVWLSLNNAMLICGEIEDVISTLDPENASAYQANVDNYISSLKSLDASFEEAISNAPRDTLLFADRFPFLYLVDDYDINYYAAFNGCSAETEASFETIAFLSDKVTELDIKTLLILDNGLIKLAQTVNNNSADKDSQILELNSIQSVSAEDISAGVTYYSMMEDNLETLKIALYD